MDWFLHIDVYGPGLPILLGTLLPLLEGPPLPAERRVYLLPQFVGLNRTNLEDMDQILGLLRDLLAYRQVEFDQITDFLLLARTPKSLDVPVSMLQRPHFQLTCSWESCEDIGEEDTARTIKCAMYMGYPYKSKALDPPNGSEEQSCMNQLHGSVLAAQPDYDEYMDLGNIQHTLKVNNLDESESVIFCLPGVKTWSSTPLMAVLTAEESKSGQSCAHLNQFLCTRPPERYLPEIAHCNGLPSALESKQCFLQAYIRTGDERLLVSPFWDAVTQDLNEQFRLRLAASGSRPCSAVVRSCRWQSVAVSGIQR